MKCFYCNAEVRWNNDYDTEDTYPDSKHLIVSMYNCDECDTWYEVFHQKLGHDTCPIFSETYVYTALILPHLRQILDNIGQACIP